MIYIINFDKLAIAYTYGAKIVTMSGNGTQAMVQCETLLDLEIVSEHAESEKVAIMALPFWRQPCKDCEV